MKKIICIALLALALPAGAATKVRYRGIEGAPVNVLDYGCKGDGTTDDRPCLASALAAAAARGSVVYLPPGKYLVNSGAALSVPSYTVVRGTGKTPWNGFGSEIYVGGSFAGAAVFDVSRAGDGSTGIASTIEDLSIDVASRVGVDGIYASEANAGATQLTLRRLLITSAGGSGVHLKFAWSSVLDDVTVDNSTSHNFLIGDTPTPGSGTPITLSLRNCYAKRTTANMAGYRIVSGNVSMTGCNGIDPPVNSGTYWGIFGGRTADGDAGGDTTVRATFIGNNVEDFGSTGIWLKYGSTGDFFSNSLLAPTTGTVKAILADYTGKGALWGNSNSITTKGAAWANAYAVHVTNAPGFILLGDTSFTTVWVDGGAYSSQVPMILTKAGQTAMHFRGGFAVSQFDDSTGTIIKRHVSGTTTWDPASVADGAMTSTTVSVTNAAIGDTVSVGFSNAVPAGALLVGAVTASGTVTVTLFNKTGAPLDLASGTLRADIWQH